LQALFYIYAAISQPSEKGGGRELLNANIFICLLFTMFILSVARLFETHVFDIGSVLASCCSFGPINPKNPFSNKAVVATYVVLPLALLTTWLFQKAAKSRLGDLEAEYRLSKGTVALFAFVICMLTPLGAQGEGPQPLFVLAGQACLYLFLAVWVRFQKVAKI
jgi:quinol-cytochrome oxidoreductase complex cytochrome b subunit